MRFFLDTADVKELEYFLDTGLVDGVTTNPTLIAKTGRKYKEVISDIITIIKGPVSAEVIATDCDNMIKEGVLLRNLGDNVVVKLPTTFDGLKACRALSLQNIPTNLTLCFSASQAIMVAKAGASYVSPFIGRLDDIGCNGIKLIEDIHLIYKNYSYIETKILVASVRNQFHVLQAAKLGADVVTVPPSILKQMIEHHLTDKGLELFLKDWEKTGQQFEF